MSSIASKRENLPAERPDFTVSLGAYLPAVDSALAEMKQDRIAARI
jgi:hypothetical protein